MRTLVLGGIRSGKSQWAEAAVAAAAGESAPVRYLATGPAADSDPAWTRRVDAHRTRRPAHWHTVETCDLAGALATDPHATDTATLVDDIGGWLTATMDRLGAWSGAPVGSEVDALVEAVDAFTAPLVLVSPEVGLTVVPATEAGRRFADELGTVNQRLAAVCDRVVLVVAGQPLTVKEPS
ncbi:MULTISPECIES: bifunctional adenosylcobinamide kinase/adenosylcobinamide-phosphate guanylyltransferase [Mycobacterium]|uniref:Adenosylcobinamide kinase n=1 Tax=Mycobacterium syngnathidarum TaxID=1908205 RepID=A0A1Q9WDY3_9MYCO|nr:MULTISPECIES: bifunctional adenosylcobinamide kinase/adenosylcobinamide-phosphate guanylyltransferase [Mycobacterium]MCG7605964.1 bifunctional adenosylcobinamide kinase/adenosylcobinamide-phosphate guanylyltransferase [Mycobacterium sp. CnD-18-1]OHU07900.1 adenosylcobinamide kinase/adenosylcobinamide phosphate guanyltransferase [Mycobacterium syngnathidarum]OLT97000.1 adenosylcobinamide kinase/adenosylcobinamide phosphate guanyltransferase [Mycobacterium syngnathidarum]